MNILHSAKKWMLGRHLGNPIFRSYVSFSFRALCWTSWEVSQISKNRHQPNSIFPLSSFCLMLCPWISQKFYYQIHPMLEKKQRAHNLLFAIQVFLFQSLKDFSGEPFRILRPIFRKTELQKEKQKTKVVHSFTCFFFRRSLNFLRHPHPRKILPKCCLQFIGAAFQRFFFQIKALHMWQSTANGTRC